MKLQTKQTIDRIINEFKTKTKEEISSPKHHFIKIKTFNVTLNNGLKITREQILRGNSNGSVVTACPITNQGKILLVAQPRVFTPLTVGFELPAGYIEPEENPYLAITRELLEETGYSYKQLEYILKYQQDPGCSSAINHCFIAEGCHKMQKQNLDESEHIEYFEATLDDTKEMLDQGLIVGSSSIITLQKVYERRKKYGI